MLVLSRKVGQQIKIRDDITIVVQRISGNRVSIGIEAPPECPILRGELSPLPDPNCPTLPETPAPPQKIPA